VYKIINKISITFFINILSQQTGIGKTVANSRKLDGEAGKLARKLLHKWKEIVSNHENENVEKKLSSVKKSEPLFSKYSSYKCF
jgi:hypothetical protein